MAYDLWTVSNLEVIFCGARFSGSGVEARGRGGGGGEGCDAGKQGDFLQVPGVHDRPSKEAVAVGLDGGRCEWGVE